MEYKRKRKAFSMITAIFVIIIMATVAMFVLNLSGKMVKETTTQYQREQAMLLAKSYTEYAVMAVTANDRKNDPCLYTIKGNIGSTPGNGNGYRARVHIAYITVNGEEGTCSGARLLTASVTTLSTPLTVMIDTYIDYKDPDDTTNWRTYHERTLQKI